jgi:hypothetical protein
MFIAMIPLFILIALAAFILQVLEFDTEMENAVAFVEQTNNLEAKFVSLKSRAIQTTDIGNLDRIHEQVGNASIYWNATQKWVRCNKNESAAGTHHYLPHKKPVSISFTNIFGIPFSFLLVYSKLNCTAVKKRNKHINICSFQ